MILVGNRRGGAANLAQHLMNVRENDHVHIHELRGFISSDLDGAFHEAYGISRGTRCKKFLYSLSLSPPETEDVPIEAFEAVIDQIEQRLGFAGQPRAIVFHEKKGRRHAHCVWSRINSNTMTAIDPFEDKLALKGIARSLFEEHQWDMPDGFKRREDADPFNYSHAEHSQAKRIKRDPKELKRIFVECWQTSDSRTAFTHALQEHGLVLARGDRRGHVAVDANGEVYSVSRWVGVKAKEVRVRLGKVDDLPNVEAAIAKHITSHNESAASSESKAKYDLLIRSIEKQRDVLVVRHRKERSTLENHLAARRIVETKARANRLPVGLKAVWFKLSGQYEPLRTQIENEAHSCDLRDRTEYQGLITRQLSERRKLQRDHETALAEAQYIPPVQTLDLDPAQGLVLPVDPDAQSDKAKVNRDPIYVLDILNRHKEYFTRRDVIRKLTDHISDPFEVGNAIDTVLKSPKIVKVQPDDKSDSKTLYTTRDMIAVKASIWQCADSLAQSKGKAIAKRHINDAVKSQNNNLHAKFGSTLSEQQERAICHCLKPEHLSAVVGLAGAGKSTMLSAVKQAYECSGYNVRGAALSGKAADGLESASGIECRTLASLELSWKNGYGKLTNKDVLIIDEAGMVASRQLLRILNEVKDSGARIILVGDPEQLQPINAGTPFKEIVNQIGAARLSEIHRQTEDWQKQASFDLAEGRIEQALDAYEVRGHVKSLPNTQAAIVNLVEDYLLDVEINGANSSRLALAHRRKDVHAINQAIRVARCASGELSDECLYDTTYGKRAFSVGDRLVFTRNDRDLGVRNGLFGMVQSVSKDRITVLLDADGDQDRRFVSINPNLYPHFDHGYASTIHRSQGATIDRTFVLGSKGLDQHLTYVAMTRHKRGAKLYGDRDILQKLQRCVVNKFPVYRGLKPPLCNRQKRSVTLKFH